MSDRHQYPIVNRILVVAFFLIKVFGLWPYKFQGSGRQMEYSIFSISYSVFTPCVILFGYLYIGSDLYHGGSTDPPLKIFSSVPMQLIVFLYSYLVIISYVILYAGQHLLYKRKKVAYFKCKKVADSMIEYRTEFDDVKPFVTNFLLKTIVYDVLNFSLFFFNLCSASVKVQSQPYLSILVYLPIFVIRLNTNIFYGGMLFFNVLYKQLNINLSKTFFRLNAVGCLRKKHHLLEAELYNLNIQLEKASMIFFELTHAMEAFNSVFSFQITLWMSTQLIMLTTQTFVLYVAFVDFIRTNENNFVRENLTVAAAILMSTYELVITGYSCNSLVREVNLELDQKADCFMF